jgi:hypothetical protein
MQYITYSELKQFRASRDKGALFSNFKGIMKSFTTNGFAYSLQNWTLVRNVILEGSACSLGCGVAGAYKEDKSGQDPVQYSQKHLLGEYLTYHRHRQSVKN